MTNLYQAKNATGGQRCARNSTDGNSVDATEDTGGARPSPLIVRVLRAKQARLGLFLLAVTALVALLGPFVAPHAPTRMVGEPFVGPSSTTPLGTDVLGRDILSRILYGGFTLVWMSVGTALFATIVGALVGLTAACSGRTTDALLMRTMDVLLSFPNLIFALLFVAMFGRSEWLLVLLVGVSFVPGVARVMRGAALPVLDSEYALWARAVGISSARLLVKEVLPNVTSPLMVECGMRLVWGIGTIASLSYIGYGIEQPAADWGLMVSENQDGLLMQPLTVLVPIIMIVIFALGGNFVAETIARLVARTERRT